MADTKQDVKDLDGLRKIMAEDDIRRCLLEYMMELVGVKMEGGGADGKER